MSVKGFTEYPYYPALRTRNAEIAGLAQLSNAVKENILPLLTVGKLRKDDGDLTKAIGKCKDAMGDNPFIMDLSREPTFQVDAILKLLESDGGFRAWCDFLKDQKSAGLNFVPTLQLTSKTRVRDAVRQALRLEAEHGRLAIRVKATSNLKNAINALSLIDDPENAILFIDADYIRGTAMSEVAATVTDAINEVRDEVPEAVICVLSTSFPPSISQFGDRNGRIEILEQDLFDVLGGETICIHGDHGSIHSRVYPDAGGRYTPRIDVAMPRHWQFERRPGMDKSGYIDAAQAIVKAKLLAAMPEKTWGEGVIRKVADGDIDGNGAPSTWISVRVNMHITQQYYMMCDYLQALEEASDDD